MTPVTEQTLFGPEVKPGPGLRVLATIDKPKEEEPESDGKTPF